jgi:hypothetical protein
LNFLIIFEFIELLLHSRFPFEILAQPKVRDIVRS